MKRAFEQTERKRWPDNDSFSSKRYLRRKPTSPRQRRSKAPLPLRETPSAPVGTGEADADGGVNVGLCTQQRGGAFSSIGEIRKAHPVVKNVRKDMEAQVS
jgi:hypothetical protein